MKELEISAKTLEEAIQLALDQLGVSRKEVEVTILKEGKAGVFGLGAEEAKIRVEPLVPVPEESAIAEMAKNILETLLAKLGVTASVLPHDKPPVEQEDNTNAAHAFDIQGDDLGILIGRRGQTLSCLQYFVRLILAHQMKTWVPVTIDVEGYRQRRYEALQTLAQHMAEQVQARQTPLTLEPMPAYERRIIHLTLAEHSDVTTHSIGEGEARKVVILPREQ